MNNEEHIKFNDEELAVRSVLEPEEIIEIQLLQETENLVEILVIVTPDEYIQSYVRPLSKINYQFNPQQSSIVKLMFEKGETVKYRLYLSQAN
jgi:hypothetical protein